jgi:hypothetical protein
MQKKPEFISHGNNRSKGWVGDILAMVVLGILIASYYFLGNSIFNKRSAWAESASQSFMFSISISVLLYIAFRQMFAFLNTHFPWNKSKWKRIFIQLIFVFLIAGVGMTLFMKVWSMLFVAQGYTRVEYFSNITTAVLVSFIVNLLYESISIFRMLKNSEIETEKLKRRNIESHYEILKNQVGPHFLFNSLNTLLSLMDEDIPSAKKFVEQLAAYYRFALQVNDRETNSLDSELKLIDHFVFLLKCRFGEHLKVTISDELKAEGSRSMVPMALQMLVENAVKHNIISSQKPLEIEIGINNNYIFIQNNLQRKESLESSNGIGLENIRSRYIMLSGKDIVITDKGTYFRVELPIIQES